MCVSRLGTVRLLRCVGVNLRSCWVGKQGFCSIVFGEGETLKLGTEICCEDPRGSVNGVLVPKFVVGRLGDGCFGVLNGHRT